MAIADLAANPLSEALSIQIGELGPDDLVIIISHVEHRTVYSSYAQTLLALSDGSYFDLERRQSLSERRLEPIEGRLSGTTQDSDLLDKTYLGPTVWTLGCNTAFSLPASSELGLRTTRMLTYSEAAAAGLLIKDAKTPRDMLNSLLMRQRVRNGVPQPKNIRPDEDHPEIQLPSETYTTVAEAAPGNNFRVSSAMALA
jgi:hypothetical protein